MTERDKYRDNDDVRDPTPAEDRVGTNPDTKSEARGDARENIGNTARGTAASPTGPAGNEARNQPRPDGYDDDLEADNNQRPR